MVIYCKIPAWLGMFLSRFQSQYIKSSYSLKQQRGFHIIAFQQHEKHISRLDNIDSGTFGFIHELPLHASNYGRVYLVF